MFERRISIVLREQKPVPDLLPIDRTQVFESRCVFSMVLKIEMTLKSACSCLWIWNGKKTPVRT
jgi:hypothetical protein